MRGLLHRSARCPLHGIDVTQVQLLNETDVTDLPLARHLARLLDHRSDHGHRRTSEPKSLLLVPARGLALALEVFHNLHRARQASRVGRSGLLKLVVMPTEMVTLDRSDSHPRTLFMTLTIGENEDAVGAGVAAAAAAETVGTVSRHFLTNEPDSAVAAAVDLANVIPCRRRTFELLRADLQLIDGPPLDPSLTVLDSLRQMVLDHEADGTMRLWMTEIGYRPLAARDRHTSAGRVPAPVEMRL